MTRELDYQSALALIYAAIKEYNDGEPEETQLKPAPATVIFDWKTGLDSMGLATFMIFIEEQISARLELDLNMIELAINYADEHPFRNVEALAQFICQLLNTDA